MSREVLAMDTSDDQDKYRAIAADWHGGQWSALYAYASTGSVIDGLKEEITAQMDMIGRHPEWLTTIDDKLALVDLFTHVEALMTP